MLSGKFREGNLLAPSKTLEQQQQQQQDVQQQQQQQDVQQQQQQQQQQPILELPLTGITANALFNLLQCIHTDTYGT